ncbi:MAG TPA: hypothetical protein VJ650_09765 [Gemmatimonadaceae bacterium]|nr:hypothetical protein [Gemmatimonadaceae bacterium]
MMGFALVLHIIGGTVAILSGFVALYVAKGAHRHRSSGLVFVVAMLLLALTGAGIAAATGSVGSVLGGVFAAYLVITAFRTVRPLGTSGWPDVVLLVVVIVGTATSLTIGVQSLVSATGTMYELPPFPYFMFATVGVVAIVGDVRVIRRGARQGKPRLARHLWRMCWALWIATSSFFLGQTDVIPKPIRITPVLVLPVLAVLVTMLYWLWRVRVRPPAVSRRPARPDVVSSA